ncbi:MAG TPA: T9SS type A sorting domain-containing protein [Flavobacteriales bacterium]|nr:T9SS type A sorting domain-containing protein [Flavobacteriales bacterium]
MLPANTNKRTMDFTATPMRRCSSALAFALVAAVFCTSGTAHAQNLVPNPGFEETDSCTFGLGLGELYDWYSANGTPDHLQSCQPYGTANGLPLNLFTFQQPFEGGSCVGVFTYYQNGSDEQREWIMAPLLEPLVPGQTYYCSFRANAGFGGNAQYPQIWLANDKVGMLFTTQDRPWNWGDPEPPRPNFAHVLHTGVLADTVGWTLVSGSFVADSAYQYVMIGQFFSNALTDTLHFAPPGSVFPWYPRAYTLIDALCASLDPGGCELAHTVDEQQAPLVVLYPNPASEELVIAGAGGAWSTVLDALGRVVWQGRIMGERHVVQVGHWARGSYTLRAETRSGVEFHKFVLAE